MKIRTGFVSNSSSSSFVLFGLADVSTPEVETIIEWVSKADPEFREKWGAFYSKQQQSDLGKAHPEWYPDTTFEEWLEDLLENDMEEVLYSLQKAGINSLAEGLEWIQSDYDTWVGFDPTKMPLDQTFGDWQAEKLKVLKAFFGDDVKPRIISETYWS